jgi:hypothetical protein
MIKRLPEDAIDFKAIQDFWSNQNTDFDSWHVTSLSIPYKGKGDREDLNNCRGICVKETTAKIISVIISNRLLKRLDEIGDRLQFGHIGCQEAQHTIKRALLLRRQHGIPTYALFVDLVKVFDTIQHQLLFKILQRYGLPNTLIQVIKKSTQIALLSLNMTIRKAPLNTPLGYNKVTTCLPYLFFLSCKPSWIP